MKNKTAKIKGNNNINKFIILLSDFISSSGIGFSSSSLEFWIPNYFTGEPGAEVLTVEAKNAGYY